MTHSPYSGKGREGVSQYASFLAEKFRAMPATGLIDVPALPVSLFPHQDALTRWALKCGRAAIFADTGLGKARMSISWANAVHCHTNRPVLMLEPPAVGWQMVNEGQSIGINVNVCRDGADVRNGINVTNYERLHRFDPREFIGVVLGESSIIKHHDAKTFSALTEAFAETPFKLPESATPAPNDWTELGTHAEFLGVCTRSEMLAEFFVHDGGDTHTWRLKGHARAQFWKWVSTWGAMVRKPSDLGFDDTAYNLPALHLHEHLVDMDHSSSGMLFAMEAQTLQERRRARKESLEERVAECCARVNSESSEPWVVWCDLNAESEALTKGIEGAIEVRGSMELEEKEDRLRAFSEGKARVIVTKPSIAGHGLNWQHSARMAFVGVTDSYEAYYQAVRRQWRFGQRRPVHVHIFASKAEGAIVANLKRKERDSIAMAEALTAETRDAICAEVTGTSRETNIYNASDRIAVPTWLASEAA
jgi:hypothetical protein